MEVTGDTIHRSTLRTRIVVVGQRRRSLVVCDGLTQMRELTTDGINQSFCPLMLHLFVSLSTMTNRRTLPTFDLVKLHVGEYDSAFCPPLFWGIAEMHIEIATRPVGSIVVLTVPRRLLMIAVEVVVHIRQRFWFETQIDSKASSRLWHRCDACPIGWT